MKNNLVGFGLSAILHLGVTAQLWFANNEEPVIKPKETTVPLSLAMFQETVKKVPAAVETLQKKEAKVAEKKKQQVVEKIPTNENPEIIQPQIISHVNKKEKVDKKKIVVKKQKNEKTKIVKNRIVKKRVVKKKVKNKRVVQKKTTRSKLPVKKQKIKPRKPILKQQDKLLAELLKPKVAPAKTRQVQKLVQRPGVKKTIPPVSKASRIARSAPTGSRVKASPVQTSGRKKQTGSATAHAKNYARFEAAYKSRLRQLIESQKKYPRRAKRRGLQGVVKVSFVIMANGTVSQIQIVKSSGSRILDNAAKNTVKKISRRLPFPKEIKKTHWKFSLPLSYRFRS